MTRKIFTLIALLMTTLITYFASVWVAGESTDRLLNSMLVVSVLYLVFSIAIEEFFARKLSDSKTRYSFRKAISMLMILAIIVALLRIWVPNPEALLVAYGVVAAGIAVALQDVIKNLAGSIVIFFGGVYQVGNRIEVNGVAGDVIDVGLFNTTLLEIRGWMHADQATGRITTVPNGAVLHKPVQNFTKHHQYLWDELTVVVTPESDWSEATRLIGEIAETHTKEFVKKADKSLTRLERYYYVEGHILDPNVYIQTDENGYAITLRYVVDAWQRRSTNSNIWTDIISTFDEQPGIIIAPRTLASAPYPMPEA